MRIAVLSGKGGTGKTLVAVNLAAVAAESTYIDCDVEEPNGHLFFRPEGIREREVCVPIPQVDYERCQGCRRCVDFCRFNALAYIREQVMVFDSICHACGGCVRFCPAQAMTERAWPIGQTLTGTSDEVKVFSGSLHPGKASGVPIIRQLLIQSQAEPTPLTLIDCPPGSACTVMESIREADYCLLVAEPTTFGVHNLALVTDLVRLMHKPHGVVLNKCLEGINPAETFCRENGLKVLAHLPFDHELGRLHSDAVIAVRHSAKYQDFFESLLAAIGEEVQGETVAHP